MLHIPLVDLHEQHSALREEIRAAVDGVFAESRFILGPAVTCFEKAFATYCGVKHSIGVASGTDALHLILRGLGLGTGDEVIVPAFTFVATVLGVYLAGADPVLVDVRGDDALLDSKALEAAITPRTRAIVAVHLYGRCADMDAIGTVAQRYGLKVVEDAAQAHGARHRGRPAGSLGDAAAFSFYPSKNLGACGDGGVITTNDSVLAERLKCLRNWGSHRKYEHDEFGINSRLDSVQAAILSVKLNYLPDWNARRKQNAMVYRELLRGMADVRVPDDPSDGDAVYHLFVVRTKERERIRQQLWDAGVEVGYHYPYPLHRLGVCRNVAIPSEGLPQADAWAAECLSLPMYPELTEAQIKYIVQNMRP